MAYSDFTNPEKVKTNLGLEIRDKSRLFANHPPVSVFDRLQEILSENLELAAAISEYYINQIEQILGILVDNLQPHTLATALS